MKPIFIAEVKTQSPFGFKAAESWDTLFDLAAAEGDWVAVHTHPAWGGSMALVREACSRTDKPVLAKGIHHTDSEVEEALHWGAKYVLTVGRVSEDFVDRTIFEPLNLEQMYLPMFVHPQVKVMWNSRSLSTGKAKQHTVTDVRDGYKGWLAKASFILHPEDVYKRTDIDAFIVGSDLRSFVEEKKSLKSM